MSPSWCLFDIQGLVNHLHLLAAELWSGKNSNEVNFSNFSCASVQSSLRSRGFKFQVSGFRRCTERSRSVSGFRFRVSGDALSEVEVFQVSGFRFQVVAPSCSRPFSLSPLLPSPLRPSCSRHCESPYLPVHQVLWQHYLPYNMQLIKCCH